MAQSAMRLVPEYISSSCVVYIMIVGNFGAFCFKCKNFCSMEHTMIFDYYSYEFVYMGLF